MICGIDVGKTKCCARFCDYRGLEVYHKVWFDKTENLDAIGCQITAAMHKENKTDIIIAFEPTGHYRLTSEGKYVKPIERDELNQYMRINHYLMKLKELCEKIYVYTYGYSKKWKVI